MSVLKGFGAAQYVAIWAEDIVALEQQLFMLTIVAMCGLRSMDAAGMSFIVYAAV